MSNLVTILNHKPKTSRPTSMDILKPGEAMHMGKNIIIEIKTTIDLRKETITNMILITHDFGFLGKHQYKQSIYDVIDLTEISGIKATPIALEKTINGRVEGLHIFTELTKTLQATLQPAS